MTMAMVTSATDIIGLGDQGYGLATYTSFPVRRGNRISVSQLQGLFRDLNTVTQHVSGQFTTTMEITTGSAITSSTFTALWRLKEYVNQARFQLHPSQRSTYTGALGITEDIWNQNSTSTRTQLWNTTSTSTVNYISTITHQTRIEWATTSLARYFFNSGGDLVFKPFWTTGTGQMASTSASFSVLDNAWARFVGTGTAFVTDWSYTRADFVKTESTTTRFWGTASTLSIVVTVVRLPDLRGVDFRVDYRTLVGGNIWYDDSQIAAVITPPAPVDNPDNFYDASGDPNPGLDLSGGGLGDDGSGAGGGGAKVICTELYYQGLLDQEVYVLDQQFGHWLAKHDPVAYWGYRAWADILVKYMRGQGRPIIPRLLFWLSQAEQQALSQKLALSLARFIAEPFAYELARRVRPGSRPFRPLGWLTVSLGLPVCKLIGWARGKKGKKHAV